MRRARGRQAGEFEFAARIGDLDQRMAPERRLGLSTIEEDGCNLWMVGKEGDEIVRGFCFHSNGRIETALAMTFTQHIPHGDVMFA